MSQVQASESGPIHPGGVGIVMEHSATFEQSVMPGSNRVLDVLGAGYVAKYRRASQRSTDLSDVQSNDDGNGNDGGVPGESRRVSVSANILTPIFDGFSIRERSISPDLIVEIDPKDMKVDKELPRLPRSKSLGYQIKENKKPDGRERSFSESKKLFKGLKTGRAKSLRMFSRKFFPTPKEAKDIIVLAVDTCLDCGVGGKGPVEGHLCEIRSEKQFFTFTKKVTLGSSSNVNAGLFN